jgi:hypothetical protein
VRTYVVAPSPTFAGSGPPRKGAAPPGARAVPLEELVSAEDRPVPGRPRAVLVLLAAWCLLQLPRLIAVPLIRDVLAGAESPAWLYPAILDVVVAVAAVPVAWLLLRRRGLLPFVAGVLFLVVSMVDHGDALTAGLTTPTPQIFGGAQGPGSAAMVPLLQSVVDLVALAALLGRRTRAWLGVDRPGPVGQTQAGRP